MENNTKKSDSALDGITSIIDNIKDSLEQPYSEDLGLNMIGSDEDIEDKDKDTCQVCGVNPLNENYRETMSGNQCDDCHKEAMNEFIKSVEEVSSK